MALPLLPESSGIRVPRWAIVAIVTAASLIGAGVEAGFAYGRNAGANEARDQIVDYRLCRIEHALSIEPWQGCPQMPQVTPGGRIR